MTGKKKLLVVRYRFIGDTILTLPFLKNLRLAEPNAQIDMLVAPKSGEIIEDCPFVDNFIYFDTTRKHRYENGQEKKKSFWHYVKLLRENKYDRAYVLKRSLSSALLVFLAGIKERIGFDTEHRGFLLTKKVKYEKNRHEAECFLDVLRADGIKVTDNKPENTVNPDALAKVDGILKENNLSDKKLVIVHATATNEGKLWDLENFSKVTEYLINEKDVNVIFYGTDFDSETYVRMLKMIKSPLKTQPLDLCGKLSLKESLALTKRVHLLIGNDSGNLHMASSVGTPVIGIYGPMPFEKWYALGENNILLHSDIPCSPCGLRKKCPNNKQCLRNITAEQVIGAVDKILKY